MMRFRNDGKREICGRLLFGNSGIAAIHENPEDMPLSDFVAWRLQYGEVPITRIRNSNKAKAKAPSPRPSPRGRGRLLEFLITPRNCCHD